VPEWISVPQYRFTLRLHQTRNYDRTAMEEVLLHIHTGSFIIIIHTVHIGMPPMLFLRLGGVLYSTCLAGVWPKSH
jgi:hypothetical protein